MTPLEELIVKKLKEGKVMSPMEQKAKMANIDALKNEMHGMMKNHLNKDGASVEVSSDSPEGLKAGLDQAQDTLGDTTDMSDDDSSDMDDDSSDMEMKPDAGHMIEESIEHESAEGDLSPEEIDQLQMLLAKLKMKKV